MDDVPQAAIDAAMKGVLAAFGADRAAASESVIHYALTAAAPHLAAAERERVADRLARMAAGEFAERHGLGPGAGAGRFLDAVATEIRNLPPEGDPS